MKRGKKSLIVTLTFFAALLALNLGVVKASAASRTVKMDKVAYAFVQQSHTNLLPIQLNDAKLLRVKSSNQNVARVSVNKDGKSGGCHTGKKGNATITYTLKENGKTYKLKQKIVVTDNYPFEKLKVNKKNVIKSLKNLHSDSAVHKKKSYTVKWKLKKGWKVQRAMNESTWKEAKSNSTKVNLKGKDFSAIAFNFVDKDGHVYMNYIIPLWAK